MARWTTNGFMVLATSLVAFAALRCSSDGDSSGAGSSAGSGGVAGKGTAGASSSTGGASLGGAGSGGRAAGGSGEVAGMAGAGGDGGDSEGGSEGGSGPAQGGGAQAGEGGGDTSCAVDGNACDLDGSRGLCRDGACEECADPADDAACAEAHGQGHLCIEGVCTAGGCRSADDCAATACVENVCGACRADGDCPPETICDRISGGCVSPAECEGVDVAGECPVNPDDICCGAAVEERVCAGAECCSDAECASQAGTVCVRGRCVDDACEAPTDHHYYVDSGAAAPGDGTGSSECPYGSLTDALALVRDSGESMNDPVTLTLSGRFDEGTESDFPLEVPSNVTITTDAGELAQIVARENTSAFLLDAASNVVMENLNVRQASLAAGVRGAGVRLINGSTEVVVSALEITNFRAGLSVGGGSALTIGPGVYAHENDRGLYVNDGSVLVDIDDGQDQVLFSDNRVGIWVSGKGSSITLLANPIPGTLAAAEAQTIGVSGNGEIGIRLAVGDSSADASLIDGVDVSANGSDGLSVPIGAAASISNSFFRINAGHGAYLRGSAAGGLLEFGTAAVPGGNVFDRNGGVDLCIGTALEDTLPAEGNTFDGNSCLTMRPVQFGTCSQNVEIGWDDQILTAEVGEAVRDSVDVLECGFVGTP